MTVITPTNLKAWVSLLGAIVTALLASGVIPVGGRVQDVLTIISVVVTAVGTWLAPYVKDVKTEPTTGGTNG